MLTEVQLDWGITALEQAHANNIIETYMESLNG